MTRYCPSLPAHPSAFRQVWRKLDGRVVCKGYVGSSVDSFPRRFMDVELELGGRVALVFA